MQSKQLRAAYLRKAGGSISAAMRTANQGSGAFVRVYQGSPGMLEPGLSAFYLPRMMRPRPYGLEGLSGRKGLPAPNGF
jgi:hypothetical protein